MEPKNNIPSILCSLHPKDTVQRVDLDPQAKKQLYCYECLLESDDPKKLATTLQTMDRFISTAALFYTSTKQKVHKRSECPSKYLDVLARQGESLDQFTNHINQEKKKIHDIFKELKEVVINKINQQENMYLQLLDDNMFSLYNQYTLLEKNIKKTFPKDEDIDSLFPSKEELVNE